MFCLEYIYLKLSQVSQGRGILDEDNSIPSQAHQNNGVPHFDYDFMNKLWT